MWPLHEGNALADCLTKINFLLQRKLKIIMLCIIKMLRCLGFSFTFPVTLFMPLLKAHDLSNLLALFTSWSKSSGFFFPKVFSKWMLPTFPVLRSGHLFIFLWIPVLMWFGLQLGPGKLLKMFYNICLPLLIGMACAIKTENAPAYSPKDGTTHNGLGPLPSAKKIPYRLSRWSYGDIFLIAVPRLRWLYLVASCHKTSQHSDIAGP